MDQHTTHVIDAGMIAVAGAAFIGWLPAIASVLSIVWMAIRIYETKTVQRWLGKKTPSEKV